MEQVQVQYRDRAGNWTTVMVVQNLPANIRTAMQSVSRANPGCRVRAVDRGGRVVDML